jgi:hypothetical protein
MTYLVYLTHRLESAQLRQEKEPMAIKTAQVSIQVVDADGTAKAFDLPIQYDDATASLANILSWVSGLGVSLDTVVDGKLTKIRLCLSVPLPGGIKAIANASSINERTGLITFSATGTPNAYGVDVPCFLPSLFSGDTIPDAGATAAFEAYLVTPVNTIRAVDRYGNVLAARKSAKKTFRE